MPKLKNKNTNKNKNNIHITIHNNSSTKRKRKGKSKSGPSSIPSHHGNSMPTIIQSHQVQPLIGTSSQIADNKYGVGMSEKIDALAGGVTRVLENIENKQQEHYTREKNESYLRKQLQNREDELSSLSRSKPPSVVAPLNVAPSMGSNTLMSSLTPSFQIQRAPPPSIASDDLSTLTGITSYNPSLKIPRVPPPSLAASSHHSLIESIHPQSVNTFHGSLNDEHGNTSTHSNFLDSVHSTKSNKDPVNYTNIYDGNVDDDNISEINPMEGEFIPVVSKSAQKRAKARIAAEKHKRLKEEELRNPEGPPLTKTYNKTGKYSKKQGKKG